jgi:hypothetical protein
MNYVRLTTVALLMGVTISWMRGLVYQKVLDDERDNPAKGSPYIVHVKQIVQALVAMRMRKVGVGYDAIRMTVDKFDIDRAKRHEARIAHGVKVVLDKSLLVFEAKTLLKEANDIEYGAEQEAA